MNNLEAKIQDALFKLMEKKDYSQISVSEIVQKVGCSRTSFYRIFTCKDDIAISYIKSGFVDLAEQKEKYGEQEFAKRMLQFVKADKVRMKLLFEHGFTRKTMELIDEEAVKQFSDFEECDDRLRYSIYACNGMMFNSIVHWVRDDCGTDIDILLGLIEKIRKEKNLSIILVSHHMEDVANYAERVLVLHEGKLVMDDSPEKVFGESEYLKKIGIGIPQVTSITEALIQRGMPLPYAAVTVEQAVELLQLNERRRTPNV